jgi:hypothetical protein
MSVNGKITKCTAKVEFNGRTVKFTKVTTKTTKNTELVLSVGRMVENMLVNGNKENSTEEDNTIYLTKAKK